MERPGLPDGGVLSCLSATVAGRRLAGGARRTNEDDVRKNDDERCQPGSHRRRSPSRRPQPVVIKAPWWERPALFRYGFVALILIVWEIVGPFINPIFFTYPTKIAAAFYDDDRVRRIAVFPRRKAWRSWSTA